VRTYFYGGSTIRFDFSDVRPKGARLVTSGGKAPGPQPLKECLLKIRGILDEKEEGDKLESIEVHDIVCHIADAVLAGGIRRAALISLFSADDDEMLAAKTAIGGKRTHKGDAQTILSYYYGIELQKNSLRVSGSA